MSLIPQPYAFYRPVLTYVPKVKQALTLPVILDLVSKFTKVPKVHIKSKSRKGDYIVPRQIYCYLAKRHTLYTYKAIADNVNGLDHTFVIHSVNRIEGLIGNNRLMRETVGQLETILSKKYITCVRDN